MLFRSPLRAAQTGLPTPVTSDEEAMVVPVMPVSQALLLSGVLVAAGLLIFVAAALPRLWHPHP